jgi:cytochrome P450
MQQAAPVVIDLTNPDYWVDPYPIFTAARAAGRTAITTSGEIVLLAADDADLVHMDPRFAVPGLKDLERIGIFDGPFYEWRRHTLAVMDGPPHTRLRSFVGTAFAPTQMKRLRALATERANALIDARAEAGTMDVLKDFASDLPLWTMCRFIGIDDEDRERLGAFLVGTEEGFTSPMTPERRKRCETSILALNDYVTGLIERRRADPREDVVGILVREQRQPNGPSDIELHSLIVNIVGGSVGSTRAAFANAILEFARHPDQAEIVRRDPISVKRAVEECLRFHPPFRFGRRVAKEAMNLFGLDIEPGQSMFIPRQAYNRDPARFDAPDVFDVNRPERRHLSFSYGAHFCLGQAVARTNLQEGLRVFLDRCRNIELVEQPRRVPFTPDEQLANLHIRFRAPQ